MKSYLIKEFKNKEAYIGFINYMLLHSDTFSLVYFKYCENEKVKKSVKEIQNILKPYKIFAVNGNQWPSTVTLNKYNHIYKIVLYKSVLGAEKALSKVENLFDWDYPLYPMDLCFYKDGYAWFSSSSHSYYACLYTNNERNVFEIKDLGTELQFYCDINDSNLFSEKSLKTIIKDFNEANHLHKDNTGDGSLC